MIKKSYSDEESYTVARSSLSAVELQTELAAGRLNMIQSATVETQVWVIDGTGFRVAMLEKDGGCMDGVKIEVEVR
jgi:hypothetical protein